MSSLAQQPPRETQIKQVKTALRIALALAILAAATGIGKEIGNSYIGVSQVCGRSMEPTIQGCQVVFWGKWREPERGDIVQIDRAGETITIVKRVAFLPGETPPGASRALGTGEYWVLGDNEAVSRDSRRFGPVRREDIKGTAIGVK